MVFAPWLNPGMKLPEWFRKDVLEAIREAGQKIYDEHGVAECAEYGEELPKELWDATYSAAEVAAVEIAERFGLPKDDETLLNLTFQIHDVAEGDIHF